MSRGLTSLPTTGVFSGLAEQNNINTALAALLSLCSGGSAPAFAGQPAQYQLWADTSVSGQITVRQYIGTSWVPIWIADTATGLIALASSSPQNWVAASGTHDAITAAYDPPVTALIDGMVLNFRAASTNLTTAPTFSPNGLAAKTITKNGGIALVPGDIRGALFDVSLRWNAANNTWMLLNPPWVPVGGTIPYFGGTIPSDFALPQGQNLSATTFPAANAVLGTTYGNPGGGNFTMPDLRGRFFFNLDANSSGRITAAGGNFDGTVLGGTGGAQSRTIAQNQLPNVALSVSGSTSGYSPVAAGNSTALAPASGQYSTQTYALGSSGPAIPAQYFNNIAGFSSLSVSGSTQLNGGVTQQTLSSVPPAMGINCMMRIA